MTDRALGRMTMRRQHRPIGRRIFLRQSDRVAITYTAEQMMHLLKQERRRGKRDAERDRRIAEKLAEGNR